jgi:threonine/homoserine/homoserine lactone efflux protein
MISVKIGVAIVVAALVLLLMQRPGCFFALFAIAGTLFVAFLMTEEKRTAESAQERREADQRSRSTFAGTSWHSATSRSKLRA